MKRRLGESRAWLEAADGARVEGGGLCCWIDEFLYGGVISPTTYRKMTARIEGLARRQMQETDVWDRDYLTDDVKDYLGYHFLWPTDEEGQKARTRWARRQSELAKVKGKRAKARR